MRRSILLLLTLLTAAPLARGADIQKPILDGHNAERRAVGVPPVAWDDALASQAATWARHLAALGRLEHSAAADRPGEGENLWMGTAGAYAPAQMAAGWTAEKADFANGVFPDVARDGHWRAVGHYTQMIWRGTTKIGCATASSPAWDVLVCRYAPAGNMVGEWVY